MRGRKPEMKSDKAATKTPVSAPSWLSKEAKDEWRRVMPILIERRILTDGDLGILQNYCVATATLREAHRLLTRDGLVLEGKKHPAFGIMNAAQTNQRLCAAELGLTPVSRSRPAVRDNDDSDDAAELGL